MHAMDQNELAKKLFVFLASGGTVEHLISEAPLSKKQIDSVFDQLQRAGRCSASEVVLRAKQLREFVVQKQNAIERQEFELAASERARELAVYQSLYWLEMIPARESRVILLGDTAEQQKILVRLFREADAAS